MSENKVDLPLPFLPTNPTFCLGLIVAEALSKSILTPRRTWMESNTIMTMSPMIQYKMCYANKK